MMHNGRLLFVIVTALVLFALFITLGAADYIKYREGKRSVTYTELIDELATLVVAVNEEASAAILFTLSYTDRFRYDQYIDQQKKVDNAYRKSFQFIEKNKDVWKWSADHPLANSGTIMSDQGFANIMMMRSKLTLGQTTVDVQTVRDIYYASMYLLITLMCSCGSIYDDELDFSLVLRANAMLDTSQVLMKAQDKAVEYLSTAADGSMSTNQLLVSEASVYSTRFSMAMKSVLEPLLNRDESLLFRVEYPTLGVPAIVAGLQKSVSSNSILMTQLEVTPDPMSEMLAQLNELRVVTGSVPVSKANHYVLFFIFAGILGLAFLISTAMFLLQRLLGKEQADADRHCANTMHDLIARVGEYVDEVGSFSLSPQPPPKTLFGGSLGIAELQLQHIVGSLKAVSGTVPPFLFPDHFHRLATERSDIKDPATMELGVKLRENLLDSSITVQDAASDNPFLRDILHKTDLQEHIHDAALVFVSLTPFHNLTTESKKNFCLDHYETIVSMIEECVYEFGGIIANIAFDKVVSVWGTNSAEVHASGAAVNCARALSERLNTLRDGRRVVRDNFPACISVVGGTIDVGVFGYEERKSVAMFGPPIHRGMHVAQANTFHETSVTCDDYIKMAIGHVYPCKPVELLPCGGCAYQIMFHIPRGNVESDMQLEHYAKAFDLFYKRNYKAALKEFRAYTKQFGYDVSVERVQAIIAGYGLD